MFTSVGWHRARQSERYHSHRRSWTVRPECTRRCVSTNRFSPKPTTNDKDVGNASF